MCDQQHNQKADPSDALGHQNCRADTGDDVASSPAVEFCDATCPVKVGGRTCGAQCRLTQGHSGRHLCLKMHDF
jgi:hypothetical protein